VSRPFRHYLPVIIKPLPSEQDPALKENDQLKRRIRELEAALQEIADERTSEHKARTIARALLHDKEKT